MCNLACIEIIMQLEDKQLEDEVLDNSELLVACYFIIESAVSYMAGSTSQVNVCWNWRTACLVIWCTSFFSFWFFLVFIPASVGQQAEGSVVRRVEERLWDDSQVPPRPLNKHTQRRPTQTVEWPQDKILRLCHYQVGKNWSTLKKLSFPRLN